MGSAAAILVWLVVLGFLAWFLAGGGLAALLGRRGTPERTPPDERLRYAVPEGHDPAAVTALLAPAGYVTELEDRAGTRVLVIANEEGGRPDRTVVRELIAEAGTTIQDPVLADAGVRFLDESG